jgi:hypothetical protein
MHFAKMHPLVTIVAKRDIFNRTAHKKSGNAKRNASRDPEK